jgi:hypothetical protein
MAAPLAMRARSSHGRNVIPIAFDAVQAAVFAM